jgi:hypothetical protein
VFSIDTAPEDQIEQAKVSLLAAQSMWLRILTRTACLARERCEMIENIF